MVQFQGIFPGNKKGRSLTGLFFEAVFYCSGEGTNAGVQAALVAGSGVLRNQTLTAGLVDHRHGGLVGVFGGGFITGGGRFDDLLHRGTHGGAGSSVVLTADFGLLGAFFGLS